MSRLRAYESHFTRPPGVVEGAVVSVFRVPPEVAGQRLDVFVCSQLHRTSRTRAQSIIRASAYDADGRKLVPNDRVRPEQHVLLWRPPWDETSLVVDLPVLYEDDHFLAIDKPALLPVHPTARYHRNTVIKLLQAARPESAWLSLGHRLDRETSGVMLVSKTRSCDRALKKQLALRQGVDKFYLAITWGIPDPGDGRRSFRFEQGVELDQENPLRVKMRTSDGPNAQHAATTIDVLETRRGPNGRTYALVSCHLETGRQHQIRVHLATLGAPIVGDKLYGPDERAFARGADGELTSDDIEMLEMARHALHAARLELEHPVTRVRLAIASPLPGDMSTFWDSLKGPAELCPSRVDREPLV
jgi:23S rRNA pseudouridine1911/1915/1917 synthase